MLTSSAHAQRNRMDGSAYEVTVQFTDSAQFRNHTVIAREGLGTRLGIFSRIS